MILLAVLLLFSTFAFSDEDSWFDMENCEFCVTLTEDPHLLANTTWEHHKITNGLVSVTTVKPDFMDAYKKATAKMNEVGKKWEAGEEVKMCNMCKSMGELFALGIITDHIETKHGTVTIMTSTDPEKVARIQAWGDRTNEEHEKMIKEKMTEGKAPDKNENAVD
jgi:hypothetical protein